MESQIISLDSIAANLRLQMRSHLQHKNLNLEIINPDGRQMVKTDPELVQNILTGLVDNAIQVSEPAAAIQLSQKLSFETGMLIIEVTDFGEGLTPEEQRIFFNAEKDNIPGIGSIRSIRNAIRSIRVLNGKIWLRSKKGNFTTFRVQLPVRIID
jgi:signal transduction histidine kinase